MNRIFFRFFMLVMLSITAATFVIYFATSRLFGDPLEDIARRQAAAQIFLVEQYVDKAPSDEWLARLNKVREVSGVKLDLIPLAQARSLIEGAQRAALERGEVVLDAERKAFYRRVDLSGHKYIGSEADVLHAQDLPIDVALALEMEALRFVIVALALLIPILMWSRSHWNGLQALAKVADDFGAGDLAARAHMRPSASVYPLAERIDHMASRIEALLEAQRNLVHSVSHELRTPITRLEFALELLRDAAGDPALEQRIGAMEGDLHELNTLVGELLSMARLDSKQALHLETFDLAEALQACRASLDPGGPVPSFGPLDDLGDLTGDRRLMARAICNLMRNAQKYAHGQVNLGARRLGDGTIQIVIDDDGPGIPVDEREKIFAPFYRLDRSRDRATGGFGLGLSIAQKALTLHGGAIAVTDSPQGGARFVITLPGSPMAARV